MPLFFAPSSDRFGPQADPSTLEKNTPGHTDRMRGGVGGWRVRGRGGADAGGGEWGTGEQLAIEGLGAASLASLERAEAPSALGEASLALQGTLELSAPSTVQLDGSRVVVATAKLQPKTVDAAAVLPAAAEPSVGRRARQHAAREAYKRVESVKAAPAPRAASPTPPGALDAAGKILGGRAPRVLDGSVLLECSKAAHPARVRRADVSHQGLVDAAADELALFSETLEELDAGDNALPLSALAPLTRLREIRLHCNCLAGVRLPASVEVARVSEGSELVEEAEASQLGLTRVERVEAFAALEVLDLSFNSLRGGAVGRLGTLPQLRELNVSYNEIEWLPPWASLCAEVEKRFGAAAAAGVRAPPFARLEVLSLEGNGRAGGAELLATCSRLPRLRELNLSKTRVAAAPDPCSAPGLQRDDADGAPLAWFEALEWLSLAGTPLHDPDDLARLVAAAPRLEEVVVAGTPLAARPLQWDEGKRAEAEGDAPDAPDATRRGTGLQMVRVMAAVAAAASAAAHARSEVGVRRALRAKLVHVVLGSPGIPLDPAPDARGRAAPDRGAGGFVAIPLSALQSAVDAPEWVSSATSASTAATASPSGLALAGRMPRRIPRTAPSDDADPLTPQWRSRSRQPSSHRARHAYAHAPAPPTAANSLLDPAAALSLVPVRRIGPSGESADLLPPAPSPPTPLRAQEQKRARAAAAHSAAASASAAPAAPAVELRRREHLRTGELYRGVQLVRVASGAFGKDDLPPQAAEDAALDADADAEAEAEAEARRPAPDARRWESDDSDLTLAGTARAFVDDTGRRGVSLVVAVEKMFAPRAGPIPADATAESALPPQSPPRARARGAALPMASPMVSRAPPALSSHASLAADSGDADAQPVSLLSRAAAAVEARADVGEAIEDPGRVRAAVAALRRLLRSTAPVAAAGSADEVWVASRSTAGSRRKKRPPVPAHLRASSTYAVPGGGGAGTGPARARAVQAARQVPLWNEKMADALAATDTLVGAAIHAAAEHGTHSVRIRPTPRDAAHASLRTAAAASLAPEHNHHLPPSREGTVSQWSSQFQLTGAPLSRPQSSSHQP